MTTDAATLIPRYAAAGFPVMPLHRPEHGRCSCGHVDCKSVGKHPRLRHGVHDASTDPAQINAWLDQWPDGNWGITPPPYHVVLDVDPRNGGDKSLGDLERQHGDLPKTLACQTGSGGWHFWLRYDGGYAKGKIAPGIDVKKAGGYLVVPPSLHECGGRYEWFEVNPVAFAPLWVRHLLNPPPKPRRGPPSSRNDHREPRSDSIEGLIRFVHDSPAGERNSRLYWAACRAHAAGHDLTPLVDAAEAIGLPRREAEGTASSATHAPVRATTTTPLTDLGRWRDRART